MKNKKRFLIIVPIVLISLYIIYSKNIKTEVIEKTQIINTATKPEETECWEYVTVGDLNYYIPMCGYIPINDSDTDGFLNPDKKSAIGYFKDLVYAQGLLGITPRISIKDRIKDIIMPSQEQITSCEVEGIDIYGSETKMIPGEYNLIEETFQPKDKNLKAYYATGYYCSPGPGGLSYYLIERKNGSGAELWGHQESISHKMMLEIIKDTKIL